MQRRGWGRARRAHQRPPDTGDRASGRERAGCGVEPAWPAAHWTEQDPASLRPTKRGLTQFAVAHGLCSRGSHCSARRGGPAAVPLWLARLRPVPRWPQVARPSLSWETVPGCGISWGPLRAQASPLLSPRSMVSSGWIPPHSKASATFQMPKELHGAPLVPQTVKNLHAVQGTQAPPLGQEDAPERQWHPLQGSCLENSMQKDPGAVVRGISKS